MYTLNVRIALHSEMHTVRLQKMYGNSFIVDVDGLKTWLFNSQGIEFALIIHDRDVTCNKSHLHLVLCSETPFDLAYLKTLFPVGYMSKCNNYDASLLYLLHCGHADKARYSVDELFTNIDYYERFPFLKKEVM